MYITWLGQSAFKFQDKLGADGFTVTTDPFNPDKTGLKMPSFEADIVTISHDHDDHNYLKALRKDPFVIDTAGEFEYKGVYIEGIDSYHDDEKGAKRGSNVIFRFDFSDLSVAHLGDLGHILTDKQIERLEGVDVLLVPIGGVYTIDAKKAVEVINQLEPRVVIPMHYQIDGLELPEQLDNLEKFIKELGIAPEYEEKLKISKKDLPTDATKLVILTV
jgi:L-ascorbate metabolism protein UlaG (beta-lactamase superfamily)